MKILDTLIYLLPPTCDITFNISHHRGLVLLVFSEVYVQILNLMNEFSDVEGKGARRDFWNDGRRRDTYEKSKD